jgi:hypothetical protein
MAEVVKGQSPRQTYTQNDYIERDIQKTLGLDDAGIGLSDETTETATKTAEVARSRNVRLANERRKVLEWYLKGVAKFSALVCRYMTPDVLATFLPPQDVQTWMSWPKDRLDFRMAFTAKPDSQVRLDMAQERRTLLSVYQMTANDPHVVRIELLKRLLEMHGFDPQDVVTDKVPEQTPDPKLAFSFQGEDLYNPMVREILAQSGLAISQESVDAAASQLFKQVALGVRDVSGRAITPTARPMGHGGPAEQVRPLSKQQGDLTGERPGPSMEAPQ